MSSETRYAVYWAPERDALLWAAGCDWLGRDPERDVVATNLRPGTREPRRYGFHATLTAPMHLAHDADESTLFAALERLSARTVRFTMPVLEVAILRNFVALLSAHPLAAAHPLRRLADACVNELDGVLRLPRAMDMQRRLQSQSLDSREAALLKRWGYPYVFDRWQFHLTLSDPLQDRATRARLISAAQDHFAQALVAPTMCASVSVFTERTPGAPFALAHRFMLAR